MSGRSYTRPRRSKVYDANYYAAENAYKSALDSIDRKYGRSSAPPAEPSVSNGSGLSGLRASLERERPQLSRRSPLADDDDSIPRRKLNTTALLDEFDDMFENRKKTSAAIRSDRSEATRSLKAMSDEADEEFAESMKRIKASRAARAAAEDKEEIENSLSSKATKQVRAKLNFSSKVIDSVGLSDESIASGRKKVLSIKSAPSDDAEDLTRWTAVKPAGRRNILDEDDSAGEAAAAARARQSRIRLQDLENEMAELDERGAAREKRIKDLRRLLSENESSSKESLHSTVRVKSSIQSEKKIISSH